MRFMQIESVLQTKNRSGPAKNRFSVALHLLLSLMKGLNQTESAVFKLWILYFQGSRFRLFKTSIIVNKFFVCNILCD